MRCSLQHAEIHLCLFNIKEFGLLMDNQAVIVRDIIQLFLSASSICIEYERMEDKRKLLSQILKILS
jgi:hypothetical protein